MSNPTEGRTDEELDITMKRVNDALAKSPDRQFEEAADMGTWDGLGAGPCMDVDDFAATVTGGKESADEWRLLAKSRLMVIEELADQLVGAERQRDHRPFEAAINEIAHATEGSAADLAQVVYAQLDKLGVPHDSH
jgi:hypothetical protein